MKARGWINIKENKEGYIGARFTKKEKEGIVAFASKRNIHLSDFVREALFSHIENVKDNAGVIDIESFQEQLTIIKSSIIRLEQKFQSYDISRLRHNLNLKSDSEIDFKPRKNKKILKTQEKKEEASF